jgi:hypothetical protein
MLVESKSEVIQQAETEPQPLVAFHEGHSSPPPLPRTAGASGSDVDSQSPVSVCASASRGLTQTLGLDPRLSFFIILVDLLVFTGNAISMGLLIPLGVVLAAVLGVITYKAQIHWFKDDHESALIKSLMVAVLTAIPFPITPLVAIPGGVLGIVKAIRRRKSVKSEEQC